MYKIQALRRVYIYSKLTSNSNFTTPALYNIITFIYNNCTHIPFIIIFVVIMYYVLYTPPQPTRISKPIRIITPPFIVRIYR